MIEYKKLSIDKIIELLSNYDNEYYNIDLNAYSDIDTHIFYKYYANESERKLCGCYLQKYYANESENFICRCNNKEEEEEDIYYDFSDSD